MPKIEPAVRQLIYDVPNGTSYIDIAKDLSIVNRRLYRQGMTYVIQDIQIGLPAGMRATDVFQISLRACPNSWIAHNAWTKGFSAWRTQQRQITDALGQISGKWSDFKVYLDDTHEDSSNQLIPQDANGDDYSLGEWEYSKLVFDDDGTEREFKMHMIGSSNLADTNEESGIALIEEYADSRPYFAETPVVPGAASNTIYAKLMGTDEMSDMLVDNIEGDNDLPPYDADDYPNGSTNADHPVEVRWGSVNATQSSTMLPGFIAPLGLVQIVTAELALADPTDPTAQYAAVAAATTQVMLTIAPGTYRGVLAAKMGQ